MGVGIGVNVGSGVGIRVAEGSGVAVGDNVGIGIGVGVGVGNGVGKGVVTGNGIGVCVFVGVKTWADGSGVEAVCSASAASIAAVMLASTFGVGTGVLVPRIFSKRWPNSGLDHFPSEGGVGSEAPRTPQADKPTESKVATITNPKAEIACFFTDNTGIRVIS